MSVFKLKSTIRIATAKRMAPYLAAEVKQLGYTVDSETETGVEVRGTLIDCMRLNLYLRTAYRVLFLIDSFEAANPDELYKNLTELPWEEYIPENGYFSISSFAENIHIRDTRFANLKVKDAVVDRFTKKLGKRPDSGPETDKTVLFLYWRENEAAIFIDTSGNTIARHGYRKMPFRAPMQESLAAAVILASKWDAKTPFVNPMCGSGTLAIEAALMAINKPPGLMSQDFGFMHINGFDDAPWKDMRQDAARQIKESLPFQIIATDINLEAIRAAQTNARYARVDHLIQFEECPFEMTPMPPAPGVVMLNPEYGERMGDETDLAPVYKSIGDFFKQKAAGYTGYIFTGNLEASKHAGLKASRRIPFYNARIDCRLLEYELYKGKKEDFKNP